MIANMQNYTAEPPWRELLSKGPPVREGKKMGSYCGSMVDRTHAGLLNQGNGVNETVLAS